MQPTFTSSWGPAWACTMFLSIAQWACKKIKLWSSSSSSKNKKSSSTELGVNLLLWGVIRMRRRVLQWVESSFLLRSLILSTELILSRAFSWGILISTSNLLLLQRLWKRKDTNSPSFDSLQPEMQNVTCFPYLVIKWTRKTMLVLIHSKWKI